MASLQQRGINHWGDSACLGVVPNTKFINGHECTPKTPTIHTT